jgi:hypothetical protein
MNKLISHLPDRRSLIGVYSTAVFLVYSWTLLASFWKVPSWLFYLKVGELLSVYAYALVVNFAESLILLFVMLLPGLFLPRRWWNAKFKILGAIWIAVLLGSIMIRLYTNRAPEYWEDFVYNQWGWWGYTLLLGIVLSFIFSNISWLRKGLETLVDRLVVFLYLYLPLTVVAILVLFVRIIF